MRNLGNTRRLLEHTANVLSEGVAFPDRTSLLLFVLATAFCCRDENRKWSEHPTKIDMLRKIDATRKTIASLQSSLDDPQIIEACGEVWLAAMPKKVDRTIVGQSIAEYKALDRIEQNRTAALSLLRNLDLAFEYMIKDFRLREREGRYRAWSNNHLEPKQFTAFIGIQVFMAIRKLDRSPGPNNSGLTDFLGLIWELSTGAPDVTDWTTPIRVARGEPYIRYRDRFNARYAVQLVADDLLNDFRTHIEGRFPFDESEFKPPKLVTVLV